MRRPIKYKAYIARRNRIALIATTTVLAIGIIGGTAAAIASSRAKDPNPVETTPEIVDTTDVITTEPITTEPITTEPIDTTVTTEEITTPSAESETEPVTEEITEVETEELIPPSIDLSEVGTVKNYRGGTLDLTNYSTLDDLAAAAKKLHGQGYTAVMLDLKLDNGKLAYLSEVAEAETYGANPDVAAHKLGDIVDVLHKEGLYVTARVSLFRDDIAAKANGAAALMNVSGFRYSDGASRWLSVYSIAAKNYVYALISEIGNAGVNEITMRNIGLPANAGTKEPAYSEDITKEEAVIGFISWMRAKLPHVTFNLELDALTIANGGDEVRGINVAALAACVDSITADLTLANLGKSLTVGDKTISNVYADPKATVELLLSAIDTSKLPIRPMLEATNSAATNKALIRLCSDKGYEAYQMVD